MKCPNCKFWNPTGTKFCVECGVELLIDCPNCRASNQPQFKFCGACGHSLRAPVAPVLLKDLSFDEKLAKIQKYLPGARGLGEIVEKSPDLKEFLP